jgi:hypothetical protein
MDARKLYDADNKFSAEGIVKVNPLGTMEMRRTVERER